MTVEDILAKLETMGSTQTKSTLSKHGAREPFFGVRVGDLKKLVKDVKKDQELALALYDTGIHDAMYLAGLTVNPKLVKKETLQEWVKKAYWYMPAEYTVAGVAAESPYAVELAQEWISTDDEMTAVAGWSTYANYLSITPDENLDIEELRTLLRRVETTIHEEKNRVRYSMNNFVICVGAYVAELHKEAVRTAEKIGKVHVDVGDTACKVPLAADYIKKIEDRGKIGAKRKTCIC